VTVRRVRRRLQIFRLTYLLTQPLTKGEAAASEIFWTLYIRHVWLGGRVVREPDLLFECRPPRCRVQPWASCLDICASVTMQYNLLAANGR